MKGDMNSSLESKFALTMCGRHSSVLWFEVVIARLCSFEAHKMLW